MVLRDVIFFFVKQKTAYEMRISDWSSDVCSSDLADEARTFLSMPHPEPDRSHGGERKSPAPTGSPEAARRLVGMSQPILGTVVEAYLRERAITALHGTGSLRFHPRCYYRTDEHSPTEPWPAMIAAVTDLAGRLTGANRTRLPQDG